MTTLRTINRNEVEEYLSEHETIKINQSISESFHKTNCNIDVKDKSLKELDEHNVKMKGVEVSLAILHFNAKLELVLNRN